MALRWLPLRFRVVVVGRREKGGRLSYLAGEMLSLQIPTICDARAYHASPTTLRLFPDGPILKPVPQATAVGGGEEG